MPSSSEPQAEQPSIAALMKKIDALQRRLDEGRPSTGRQVVVRPCGASHHTNTRGNPPPRRCQQLQCSRHLRQFPGLLPPEPMGSQFEDALRSTRRALIRIPGTESEVRVYGFAKASGYNDFGPRNQK